MSILQPFKMAWRSIVGKKGRSTLTILSIFIGIAAVMTIVSVMEGMKLQVMKQFNAMGANRIEVQIEVYLSDESGNSADVDYFPKLYSYCQGLKKYVVGVTPVSEFSATVVYGFKSSASMEEKFDKQNNLISGPPKLYYGSDQYSACNNLALAKGRDLTYLDIEKYNQVCVLGAAAAKEFFGGSNPIGQVMQVNGKRFTVVGVYASRGKASDQAINQMDNIIVFPYTASRTLEDTAPSNYIIKARDADSMNKTVSSVGPYLKRLIPENIGYTQVQAADSWQKYQNESLTMISRVLGGIAAISLLVGGIGIMNIMLVTVTERTREIGIRRAIGAQRSSIVVQFLIESGMLCGVGGIVGIIFGTCGSIILSRLMYQTTILPMLWITVAASLLSVMLGVLFGSYPAAKTARLQPVEALRAE